MDILNSKCEIKNGLFYIDGRQVDFKKSPNTSGAMRPEILVCHDTASPLNSSGPINWLTNPNAGASAHFVVGRDEGDITQLVPCNVKAWHAGKSSYYGRRDVNNFSVGIENVNPGAMSRREGNDVYFSTSKTVKYDIDEYNIKEIDPEWAGKAYWMAYTEWQIACNIAIGRALKAAYGIKDVTTHWFISPGRKVDTNPQFPLEKVKNAVLFAARGPVTEPKVIPTPAQEAKIEETLKQKDENEPYDAETTTSLNIRPWPDSPNRLGIIKKGAKLEIQRQSKSQKDGSVWFFVSVDKQHVDNPPDQEVANEGLTVEGFVHGNFLRMLT